NRRLRVVLREVQHSRSPPRGAAEEPGRRSAARVRRVLRRSEAPRLPGLRPRESGQARQVARTIRLHPIQGAFMAPATKPVTVDLHSHFFAKSWPDFDARFGGAPWPRMEITGPDTGCVMIGQKAFRPVTSACWDVERRLAEMDRDGIDIQVISQTPVLFSYARPADQAAEVAKIFNDMALEMCAAGKGRLHALCQVPLQDIDAACKELSRAMKAGHRGV